MCCYGDFFLDGKKVLAYKTHPRTLLAKYIQLALASIFRSTKDLSQPSNCLSELSGPINRGDLFCL